MSYIPTDLRRLVIERANGCCEYCRIHQDDRYLPHEVDHIISEKHRGDTTPENLCLSCFDCNRYKGSDISSLDIDTGEFVGLYNPRTMNWMDHFKLDGPHINPLTPQARVTEFLLQLNNEDRLTFRAGLISVGRFPCDG